MAIVSSMSNLLNGKDSRWLQLEVCREFQRNKCSRPDNECKFAHPPTNVEVQNGRVTACYDSIKGRCNREKPPCKYFHPPQHLKDQLLINGRNHLALKNALMQQMGMAPATPTPTVLPGSIQAMTANRFMTTSSPYNPYFGPGVMPIMGMADHAAAMASSNTIPTSMTMTNAGPQPQKRNVQAYPGLISYKRALENKGIPIYQPSVAAYQQLMQMSHQPYMPVSCEYSNDQSITPSNTTRPITFQASNLHHNSTYSSQNRISNPCNTNQTSSNRNSHNSFENLYTNKNIDFGHISSNNLNTSTFSADADAQIKTPTAQQNSINQTSPSKVTPSNNVELKIAAATNAVTAANDGDSENALIVQNAKFNVNGNDGSDVVPSTAGDVEFNKTNTDSLASNENDLSATHSNHVDDATQTSIQSVIDENNSNSFNSASSSSPGTASNFAALYTTSSIANNNNIILSRKNSISTPNLHLTSHSKAPSTNTTNTQHTVKSDSILPEYLSASQINSSQQAAFFSAMVYNQQLAMSQNHLYSDPAQLAKEMAQKNYANALKYAVTHQQNQSCVGKNTMPAMSYSGVTLSSNNNALYTQQPGTSASRLPSQITQPSRSPYLQSLGRPLQNPFQQFIRPQLPMNLQTAGSPYAAQYAAAAAAHQQFLSQQNLMYPTLSNTIPSPQLTATSGASAMPTQYAPTNYPYAQAINAAQSLPASMMQVSQMTSQPSQTSTSAIVLNPYKKMKTS